MIKFILEDGVKLPTKAYEHAAGFDVRTNIKKRILLFPFQRKLFKTGLRVELNKTTFLNVNSRSGQALKRGLIVLNSPGIIDSDYKGEIGIILTNVSFIPRWILPEERIAQLIPSKVLKNKISETKIQTKSKRGDGGFGSTGRK